MGRSIVNRRRGRSPYVRALAGLGVAALVLAACGSAKGAAPSASSVSSTAPPNSKGAPPTTAGTTTTTTAAPRFVHPHVFVIVMENLGYAAAMATPADAALAHRYAYTTDYYATTHPSLPNYISLLAGSTLGITSDCVTCFVNAPNLPTELTAAGVSWAAYMEAIPGPCYLSPYAPSGLYAGKHDPFAYFENIRSNPSLCNGIQPLPNLTPLLAGPAPAVPDFVWITPDICNDGHNCAPEAAGQWLTGMVSQITASAAWRDGGALYVTWDEGNGGDYSGLSGSAVSSSGGGGHVLTLVIEPGLAPGTSLTQLLDHYALLKTIEQNFHVGLLGASAAPGLATLP
ncbi:MAG: hypothetical protein M0Z47_10120 [Actinomycetota bacterium]|nr:hypothetical protein [Actinomycetota bacterium]